MNRLGNYIHKNYNYKEIVEQQITQQEKLTGKTFTLKNIATQVTDIGDK